MPGTLEVKDVTWAQRGTNTAPCCLFLQNSTLQVQNNDFILWYLLTAEF